MRDYSLKTGTYLKDILSNDSDLMDVITSNDIYPIVCPADTPFPYVTYTRDNIYPEYTKAAPVGGWQNNVSITYRVYSGDNHDLGEDIANRLRNALEWKQYKDEYIRINPILLSSSLEYYNEDGFCQQMTFSMQVE